MVNFKSTQKNKKNFNELSVFFVEFLDIYFNLCQSFVKIESIKEAQLWFESRCVKNGDFANRDSVHWYEKSYGNKSDFFELQYLKFKVQW